ncbi:MAG: beta-ketoacyl-[acyl-carrier-protein] synthase II [Cardiobacteriaceae bacterium]|nr:beta-ketoacyl-[acyl-carrier-protein] synthase II [Cardiobacteriaceae bacterium]
MTIYLNKPGVISSIGVGIEESLANLFSPQKNYLTRRADFGVGERYFGQINPQHLRAFPDDLKAEFRGINNQILWTACGQIEEQIADVVERYGKKRVAVVVGTSCSGVDENLPIFQNVVAGGGWSDIAISRAHQIMSAPADFLCHMYELDFAYGISTACTSGARAIISAARMLQAGLADAVIAAGVDNLSQLTIAGFNSLSVLSKGICEPFCQGRDGINIGEAAAVFMMTRENLYDGLPLLSWGASSDAFHMSSPDPSAKGAKLAFQAALNKANLEPTDISYINLHGTGTELNDAMESKAVAEIFPAIYASTSKNLTGHTLGASGALEAAFIWAAVSRKFNPEGKLPVQVFAQTSVIDEKLPQLRWTDKNSRFENNRRIAASSNFAFGGNNSVVIIGEE